ncbi:hypothetical protein QR680_004770 [Steinernema hermaphroditum]|uniref:Uncharacterized protein n=1 Tax=Steinernema hermaphroditum TaxID=289476 RepID=A0AA39HPR8_9BILA|nr:hypothetical protein QR680_004770 [Steinernema hermaphroditum]
MFVFFGKTEDHLLSIFSIQLSILALLLLPLPLIPSTVAVLDQKRRQEELRSTRERIESLLVGEETPPIKAKPSPNDVIVVNQKGSQDKVREPPPTEEVTFCKSSSVKETASSKKAEKEVTVTNREHQQERKEQSKVGNQSAELPVSSSLSTCMDCARPRTSQEDAVPFSNRPDKMFDTKEATMIDLPVNAFWKTRENAAKESELLGKIKAARGKDCMERLINLEALLELKRTQRLELERVSNEAPVVPRSPPPIKTLHFEDPRRRRSLDNAKKPTTSTTTSSAPGPPFEPLKTQPSLTQKPPLLPPSVPCPQKTQPNLTQKTSLPSRPTALADDSFMEEILNGAKHYSTGSSGLLKRCQTQQPSCSKDLYILSIPENHSRMQDEVNQSLADSISASLQEEMLAPSSAQHMPLPLPIKSSGVKISKEKNPFVDDTHSKASLFIGKPLLKRKEKADGKAAEIKAIMKITSMRSQDIQNGQEVLSTAQDPQQNKKKIRDDHETEGAGVFEKEEPEPVSHNSSYSATQKTPYGNREQASSASSETYLSDEDSHRKKNDRHCSERNMKYPKKNSERKRRGVFKKRQKKTTLESDDSSPEPVDRRKDSSKQKSRVKKKKRIDRLYTSEDDSDRKNGKISKQQKKRKKSRAPSRMYREVEYSDDSDFPEHIAKRKSHTSRRKNRVHRRPRTVDFTDDDSSDQDNGNRPESVENEDHRTDNTATSSTSNRFTTDKNRKVDYIEVSSTDDESPLVSGKGDVKDIPLITLSSDESAHEGVANNELKQNTLHADSEETAKEQKVYAEDTQNAAETVHCATSKQKAVFIEELVGHGKAPMPTASPSSMSSVPTSEENSPQPEPPYLRKKQYAYRTGEPVGDGPIDPDDVTSTENDDGEVEDSTEDPESGLYERLDLLPSSSDVGHRSESSTPEVNDFSSPGGSLPSLPQLEDFSVSESAKPNRLESSYSATPFFPGGSWTFFGGYQAPPAPDLHGTPNSVDYEGRHVAEDGQKRKDIDEIEPAEDVEAAPSLRNEPSSDFLATAPSIYRPQILLHYISPQEQPENREHPETNESPEPIPDGIEFETETLEPVERDRDSVDADQLDHSPPACDHDVLSPTPPAHRAPIILKISRYPKTTQKRGRRASTEGSPKKRRKRRKRRDVTPEYKPPPCRRKFDAPLRSSARLQKKVLQEIDRVEQEEQSGEAANSSPEQEFDPNSDSSLQY